MYYIEFFQNFLKYKMFICNSYDNNNKKAFKQRHLLSCHGNIPAEDNEEDRSLCQVHSSRLHNDTHVPCSLQSLKAKCIYLHIFENRDIS